MEMENLMETEKQLYALVLLHNYNTVNIVQYSFDRDELEAIANALNARDDRRSEWLYSVERA